MRLLILLLLILGCHRNPENLMQGDCVEIVSGFAAERATFHRCSTKGYLQDVAAIRGTNRLYSVEVNCINDKKKIILTTRVDRCDNE